MKRYTVVILSAAERQIKKLPKPARQQVVDLAESLAETPRPRGCEPLHGPLKGYFRVRTGNYRLIYTIDDKNIIVTIISAGDRREIYR